MGVKEWNWDIDFGRIHGGIAWPGEKPGYVVVVGEERVPRNTMGSLHHHYVIAEAQADNLQELVRYAQQLGGKYRVQKFWARDDRKNFIYIDRKNEESSRSGLIELAIDLAPYSEDGEIDYHLNMLADKLIPGKTSLHFGEESKLPGSLLAVSKNQAKIQEADNPPAAALGYVVTALMEWPPDTYDDEEEYDDFGASQRDPMTGY